MAHRDKVQQQDGKVFEVRDLTINVLFIDGEYDLLTNQSSELGPTGAWSLFEVRHKISPHAFIARWDERASAVDIDLTGVSKGRSADFKTSKDGNGGHHPVPIASNEGRQFSVKIVYQSRPVFEATIQFFVLRKMEIKAKMATFSALLHKVISSF